MGFFSRFMNNAKGLGPFSEAEVIEWKQLLSGGDAEEVASWYLTLSQIKALSRQRIDRDVEIMNESIAICEKTVNPETFFSRLDLSMQKVRDMVPFEKFGMFDEEGIPPSQALAYAEDHTDESVKEFIDRYFNDVAIKASKLKTQAAKENRYAKARESILTYGGGYLSDETIRYVYEYRFPCAVFNLRVDLR